jgi:uncharacterized repeat protein (TIGR03803 family)
LVMDSKGNLYGTTTRAGAFTWGTVFEVTPTGEETTLHTFGSQPLGESDGDLSEGTLVRDSKGNLYGTTDDAGALDGGIVFEVSPPAKKGDAWTYEVLYNFDGITGGNPSSPEAGLIMDKSGNLYGTTDLGGVNGNGAVFEVVP